MKKTLHLASFVLKNFCLNVKFGRWQTWGEMSRFVLRGTLRERRYVGSCWQEQWEGWNPFQQSGLKAQRQRFHDHRFDLAGERTVLKIHPRRSAEMCGKNKILWENVLAFHTLGRCGSPVGLQGRSRIWGTGVFRCGCGWCGLGKPSWREWWWYLVSYSYCKYII